jgi:hypothetical protein
MIIESESGTWTGAQNSHNGYYAGDFGDTPRLPQSRLAAMTTLYQVPERPHPHD